MKPKTTLENSIVALSNKLPAITQSQNKRAFSKCFSNYGVCYRKTLFCLECGCSWNPVMPQKSNGIKCVNCQRKIKLTDSYSNGLKETDYYQIITTAAEFQIVRMICISKTMKKNIAPSYLAHEVMQIFIAQDGQIRYLSKNVMGLSMYIDQWIISSDLALKPKSYCPRLNLSPGFVQPNRKVLPILVRNGFKGNFCGVAPQTLFTKLLSDTITETLLKSNQCDLLQYHLINTSIRKEGKYWNAIKICIRRNYIVTDAKMWIDYIDLLVHFWKDTRNPKYVCPSNLQKAHDKLMVKKQRAILKKTFEDKKKQINKNQKHYIKAKQQYFGLIFNEKNISINVIETVKGFLEEGSFHNHCVFTNEYYKKQNSLIFSAKVDGIPMETIQLSLENFQILQSRGKGNKASKYNKQIINLVTKNLHQIKARMKVAC